MSAESHQSNLKRASFKIKRHFKRTWCGYLTPSEFLALVKEKIQPRDKHDIERAKQYAQVGDGSPAWYYFELGSFKPKE